jgi:hypothetical protein
MLLRNAAQDVFKASETTGVLWRSEVIAVEGAAQMPRRRWLLDV